MYSDAIHRNAKTPTWAQSGLMAPSPPTAIWAVRSASATVLFTPKAHCAACFTRALDTRDWDVARKILKEIEERGTWDESPEDKQAAIRKSLHKAMTFYTPL